MLTWHNVWMARHGREMAQEMRQVGSAVSSGERPLTALAVVVGLAVLREGSEVVLFLYGVLAGGNSGGSVFIGGLAGLAAGVAFTVLTYGGLLTIPTRYIFQVTSVLIALLAAGLAAQAVQFLDQAGVVTTLEKTVWDTSAWLSESSLFGKLLHTLIGYTERPSEMQLLVYVAVLVVMAALMWMLKPPAKQPALAEQT
jgi:high-affinity iron transporter